CIAVIWGEERGRLEYDNPIRVLPEIAANFFIGIAAIQYGAVYLLVPLFVAPVIAAERERKTLDLVLTTSLRDRQIVLGKLASRLAVVALLVLAGLPLLSLVG